MDYLLTRESKYPGENFNPGEELKENYPSLQILVVGAGGLGCEILKNLALCGIKHIFVVDLDTIELSNLNRQFLFRQKDIGRFKAEVACEFIKRKYPDIEIKSSCKKIQEFSDEFFRRFHIIIGGLDNIEARSYINQKVHDLVEFDEKGNPDISTVIPFVDGGTEGFRGQTKVIIPYKTSCFDCGQELINTNRNTFAMCTIAENPRVPEHCIEYAFTIEWDKNHNRPVDKDSIEDVEWIYKTALERAKKYKIEGVTYNLTLGVIKNVIPAIASTNSLIAASTVMEALKIWAGFSKRLDNYFMYMGHEGLYSSTLVYEKLDNCKTCSKHVEIIKVEENEIWKNTLVRIIQTSHISASQEFRIFHNNQYVYRVEKETNSENLKAISEIDETKTIKELVDDKLIDIKKLFELIPTNDLNNVTKVKLKRPQDFEEEE